MKTGFKRLLLWILGGALSVSLSSCATEDKTQKDPIFPGLDQVLIAIWQSCSPHNNGQNMPEREVLQMTWQQTNEQSGFIMCDKSQIHKLYHIIIDSNNYPNLRTCTTAHELLLEFKQCRDSLANATYSLDQLIAAFDLYQELRYAVYDPMMGLYEWNEFEALYKGIRASMETYQKLSIKDLPEYHPHIPTTLHKDLISEVFKCLNEFEISLESGYQTDFELPCDEIEKALTSLFQIYNHQLEQ